MVVGFLAIAPPTYARGGHAADIADTAVGMSNMPRPAMLKEDMLVSELAVDMVAMSARAARGHAALCSSSI